MSEMIHRDHVTGIPWFEDNISMRGTHRLEDDAYNSTNWILHALNNLAANYLLSSLVHRRHSELAGRL